MMGDGYQQFPTFYLWAGVQAVHPVAKALGAQPAECYDTDTESSSTFTDLWCELADRPRLDIEAEQIVGVFMPPERNGLELVPLPPVLLRARVIHIGPKPGHQRVPGEPVPHLLHLEVERW